MKVKRSQQLNQYYNNIRTLSEEFSNAPDFSPLNEDFNSDEVEENKLTFWIDPLDGSSGLSKGHLEHLTCMIGIAINNRPRLGIIHKPYSSHPYPGSERTYIGVPESGLFTIDSFTQENGEKLSSNPRYVPPFDNFLKNFKPVICGSCNSNQSSMKAIIDQLKP